MLLVCLGINGSAQNLVSNPSFEQNIGLPTGGGQMSLVPPWNGAFPTLSTSDYFHSASTSVGVALPNTFIAQVNPYHGQAIAGLYTYTSYGYREYIRTQLNTPTQPGQMYQLTFSITKGNQNSVLALNATDGFGALLSSYPPNQQQFGPSYTSNIQALPQWEMTQLFSSTTWVTFTVDIWADSVYEYLTFGNFKDNAQTAVDPIALFSIEYFFIDSVALVPVLELTGPFEACLGDTVTYGAYPAGGLYSWTVNGVPAGSGDSLTFVMSDTVDIVLQGPGASRTRTLVFPEDPDPDLGQDLLLCDGDSASFVLKPFQDWTWTWSDGSQGLFYQTADPGWVTISVDSMGCPGIDSVLIDTLSSPSVDLGEDTILCEGQQILLSLPSGPQYLWSNGSNNTDLTIGSAGLVWGEVTNGCGTDRDSIDIGYLSPPEFRLPNDTSICETDSIRLTIVPDSTWEIVWQDGETPWSRWAMPGQTYEATVSNRCGSELRVIQVAEILIPELSLGPDVQVCEGKEIRVEALTNITSVVWDDGFAGRIRNIASPGLYGAVAANECGIQRDSLQVIGIRFPQVDLGPDTSICEGEVILLEVDQQDVAIRWQDDSDSPVFLVTESGLYEVELSNLCGRIRESKRVTVDVPQLFSFPADTSICEGDELILTRPAGLSGFSWFDGSVGNEFIITQAGRFGAQAINACGMISDEIAVQTYDCSCQIFVPTAFSPNEDGENDAFFIGTNCVPTSFSLSIYDKWGRQIVAFSQPDFTWRAEGIPEGVYIWKMESTWQGRAEELQRTQSGTITVIR